MDMLDFVLFLFVFMISEKISGLHFDGSYAGQQIKGPRVARNCQKLKGRLRYVIAIVSQRSSLELASWSQKAGSSPQNLWPILYDIGASQVATQHRQFKNV